jgi:hypothetical protein
MVQRRWFAAIWTIAVLGGSVGHALAQGGTQAAIAGVARDSTGSVLPGVTVEASSPALIEKVRTAITDEQGQYRISDLRPGVYAVTFSLVGFTTVRRENLELTAAFTANVNGDLRVGGLEETITVSGSSPTVDVQNTVQKRAITTEVIEALPSGRTFQSLGQLIPGVTRTDANDVGGTAGERFASLAVHGSKPGDMPLIFDGMRYNNMNGTGGGGLTVFMINTGNVEEMSVQTGGGGAENQVSGVFVNVIPKSGGNAFKGTMFANYAPGALQTDNLTDPLRSRGLTNVTTIDRIWDLNPAFGGPIRQDKLWFFSAVRWWGNVTNVEGIYENATLNSPFYTPDFSRPGKNGDTKNASENIRLTWQAAEKHRLNVYYDIQQRVVERRNLSVTTAPEATERLTTPRNYFAQVGWNWPITNKLLLEAGNTSYISSFTADRQPEVSPDTLPFQELSTGLRYAGMSNRASFEDISDAWNQKATLSYVTGAHAIKVGVQVIEGVHTRNSYVNRSLHAQVLNGVPRSVTVWAAPWTTVEKLTPSPSIFAQDQWTFRRATINYGLRFDYLNAYIPEQHLPEIPYVPARDFAPVKNVPNWGDISPRLGFSYDIFGTGKTAIKVSLNRYVASQTAGLANLANPIVTSVINTSRTWTDLNNDLNPDCDFRNLDANLECGDAANRNFGKNNPNATVYDQDTLRGFGKRPYDWEGMVGVQHELFPGMSLDVSYFKHWFRQQYVGTNLAVSPADFDPYCVTAPVDPRLPGGGGNQVCGFYDVKPEKFGQVNNLVTFTKNFGNQLEAYNGVDVNVNARMPGGAFLQGGMTVGRTTTDSCYANALPQLDLTPSSLPGSVAGSTLPRAEGYCNVKPSWSAGTQVKFVGSYALPWALRTSATFQNAAGPEILAQLAVPSSQVAPSLGRNLSAGANSTVTVDLIRPRTLFEDRINQLDWRLSRQFRFSRYRVQAQFDVYNALNSSAVTGVNTRYGAQWLRPTGILSGRVMKFGTQIEF